jgi:pimeloyl-ACP methyl ester carboxylesterase
MFIHGVPLNGYHWRNVIERVQRRRRCIAIDLMGLGYTEIGPSQDLSFTPQARMIAEVMDTLQIETVDLVGNDSGGAIAQIFAAHHPERLTSLVLTNCDVHDGWPPPQVLPIMQHARRGTLAPIFQPMLDRPDFARQRHARGESVPLFCSYADPSVLTDEIIRLYLQPLVVFAAAYRSLPTLLAGLRQCTHGRHSLGTQHPSSSHAHRVGFKGYFLRYHLGLLVERHHTRREARDRSCGRSAVFFRKIVPIP